MVGESTAFDTPIIHSTASHRANGHLKIFVKVTYLSRKMGESTDASGQSIREVSRERIHL